ncbi:MAG: type I-E CRISPR-associated protein Cse2/CasB [Chitinivibrionales bacterium]
MSTLIERLEEMTKKESKVRAVLKRSLAFDPGTYPSAFPYIEPRLNEDDGKWKRTVYYLIGGLWAMHWREGNSAGQSFPIACSSHYIANEKSPSIEKRFIALLDADEDQLAHRLRQMIALLKEYAIDFDSLRQDLLSWNHTEKFVQIKWARAFYRNESLTDKEPQTKITEED